MEKSIKEYFKGKNIFLTGGSGFHGKTAIEKLLRTCPDLQNIYMLLRPIRGKSLEQRLEKILNNPIFNILKEKYPENIKKIIVVNGDYSLPGLGLSEEDRQTLINKVHIFLNMAASVKFNDFLKDAVNSNLKGAKEAAELALKMKQIEVFVHLSTAYCNIENRQVIHEVLYPIEDNWKNVLMLTENCDTEILNTLSQKYIQNFPNTYTYTKRLAEHCVNDLLVGKVPTVICRPSIVINTVKEPFTGWIDNFNGPIGLLVAAGISLLRTTYCNPDTESELVFVDNIIKLTLVAAWQKGVSGDLSSLSIYHGSKYNHPPFYMRKYMEAGEKVAWKCPIESKIWHPQPSMTTKSWWFFTSFVLFQIVPAIFIDLLLMIVGQKARLFKIERKIYVAIIAVSHFASKPWSFVNTEAMKLLNKIPPKEMPDFNFNIMPKSEMEFEEFYMKSLVYVKRHMLKENDHITFKTWIISRSLYVLDIILKIIFYISVFWIIFIKFDVINFFNSYISSI